jgi:LPS-assembly lipoprotein
VGLLLALTIGCDFIFTSYFIYRITSVWRYVFLSLMIATITSCGFKLKQAITLPFTRLQIETPAQSILGTELRRRLRVQPNVIVMDGTTPPLATPSTTTIDRPPQPLPPQVTLKIINEFRDKIILSLNSAGRVREYTLRYRVTWSVTDSLTGQALIPQQELTQTREISFNESAVLAKEAEESLLYRDMQNDLVAQILRRLSVVKYPATSSPDIEPINTPVTSMPILPE